MVEFIFSCALIMLTVLAGSLLLKIKRNHTLNHIEMDVAQAMLPRSHKLCERACEIDIMADSSERYQAEEQFRDDVHQYMADFEEEVATRLKRNNKVTIKSYGGIRIKP